MENDRDEIVQKLFNMMSMSHDMSYSHSYASEYAQSKDFGNRCNAVRWMKEAAENVLGVDCPSTRDTSVQIFDKLMMHSFGDDANILQNDKFVSYSAVASLVLGAKIIDQHTELTMNKFPCFDLDYLMEFEKHVLAVTCCKISPLCTPSSYLHYMMEFACDLHCKEDVLRNADLLIAEFWEEPTSILYASSTIAISAILVSFSLLKVPCEPWLNSLPVYFFVNEENPFFECALCAPEDEVTGNAKFLDHWSCIATFENMELMRKHRRRPSAPVPGAVPEGQQAASPEKSSAGSKGGDEAVQTADESLFPPSPVSVADQLATPSTSGSGTASSRGASSAHRAATATVTATAEVSQALSAESPGKRARHA